MDAEASAQPADERTVRWRDVAIPALVLCGAWLAVAAVEFAGVWVARLTTESVLIHVAVYTVALTLTVYVVTDQWRLRRPMPLVGALVLSAAAGAGVLVVDWEPVSVHGYYRLHRADFAAVAVLAATDGGLTPDHYYGELLPPGLDHLSIKGAAARIESDTPGATALFLPSWSEYPDGPGGFAYAGDSAPEGVYDCYDSPCRPRWALGDGWYWFER
ncbi:hypothetical protein J2S43_001412 [Catenuloplanes nepalensis]|uniref:Uncharacterized protein n=1 Tax=Catenuloplanes nepalensis TaxID=587533 RepID=A0ABT9MNA8_9ACTN|nr:hypothetical protein [Catenuloplanes nepalensis]MDP9792900.1 hypothetical protein [Catenuloplanes nepalensis]